jgi:hypothetical protein
MDKPLKILRIVFAVLYFSLKLFLSIIVLPWVLVVVLKNNGYITTIELSNAVFVAGILVMVTVHCVYSIFFMGDSTDQDE